MKDDVPVPKAIPHKRKALVAAPDLWLAVWLDRDDLTGSERRRVQREKDARKAARARQSRLMGVVSGNEGATPSQVDAIKEGLRGATRIYGSQECGRWLRQLCNNLGVPLTVVKEPRDMIRAVDVLIAAPRETIAPTNTPNWERSPVWAAISYAKHRSIAVKIILSDGKEHR